MRGSVRLARRRPRELGVPRTHALEVGNAAGGATLLNQSMALQPSAHAARALAFLAPTADDAAALLGTA